MPAGEPFISKGTIEHSSNCEFLLKIYHFLSFWKSLSSTKLTYTQTLSAIYALILVFNAYVSENTPVCEPIYKKLYWLWHITNPWLRVSLSVPSCSLGLTRKYVAQHLFCCHGAISTWYFKAILITVWQVGVNAVWMSSLQAHFPFPSPLLPFSFFLLSPILAQMSLFAGYWFYCNKFQIW